MNYEYTKVTSDNELEDILALQGRNLKRSLATSKTASQGFVTVEHSLHLLKKMNAIAPHVIAKHNNRVVGYALSMHPSFANDIAILKPMFQELNRLDVADYIIMGQICIEDIHRKKGIFRCLYIEMKAQFTNTFKHIITEVDTTNVRSLNAHYAVGFKTLGTYTSNDQDWVIISLPIR
ncbi:N-acetyltransferase [Maribacter chungangensis]|uniref:N-acetyltransferase n=1 Tax=Maribacter chungangensis TaxID=1069117 RepID=A0ABW3B8I0_9FLAO